MLKKGMSIDEISKVVLSKGTNTITSLSDEFHEVINRGKDQFESLAEFLKVKDMKPLNYARAYAIHTLLYAKLD